MFVHTNRPLRLKMACKTTKKPPCGGAKPAELLQAQIGANKGNIGQAHVKTTKYPYINVKSIGVLGHSHGAIVALQCGSVKRCGIKYYGIFQGFAAENPKPYRSSSQLTYRRPKLPARIAASSMLEKTKQDCRYRHQPLRQSWNVLLF